MIGGVVVVISLCDDLYAQGRRCARRWVRDENAQVCGGGGRRDGGQPRPEPRILRIQIEGIERPPFERFFGVQGVEKIGWRSEVALRRRGKIRDARSRRTAHIQPVDAFIGVLLLHLRAAETLAVENQPVVRVEATIGLTGDARGHRLPHAAQGEGLRVDGRRVNARGRQVLRAHRGQTICRHTDAEAGHCVRLCRVRLGVAGRNGEEGGEDGGKDECADETQCKLSVLIHRGSILPPGAGVCKDTLSDRPDRRIARRRLHLGSNRRSADMRQAVSALAARCRPPRTHRKITNPASPASANARRPLKAEARLATGPCRLTFPDFSISWSW